MNNNIDYWDELARLHYESSYYNIDKIIKGESSLLDTEKNILGDIRDKKILHIQCHLGGDTISLARICKKVVGVDYSNEAIQRANWLKEQCKIKNVEFVCRDIMNLQEKDVNFEKFDIAFASYGILIWIEDLERWVRNISAQLTSGGKILLIDEHPFAAIFSGKESKKTFSIEAPYAHNSFPYVTKNNFSYIGDKKQQLKNNVQYKWAHSFSEILGAFRKNSFHIVHFEEYFKSFYEMLYNMEKDEDGYWYLKDYKDSLPLMFSLVGEKI